MADQNTAHTENMEAILGSIGMGGDAPLDARSLSFLHQLNRLFGNEESQKIDLNAYTPEMNDQIPQVIAAVEAGLKAKDEHGRSTADLLEAVYLAGHGTDAEKEKSLTYLVNPESAKGPASGNDQDNSGGWLKNLQNKTNDLLDAGEEASKKQLVKMVYNKHTAADGTVNMPAVVIELMDMADKKTLAENLKNTPHLLQNLEASIALLNNAEHVTEAYRALHTEGLFTHEIKPETLVALDPAAQLAQAIAQFEAQIGIAEPDGKWGAEEQAYLSAVTRKIQADPYFGAAPSAEELAALPENPSFRPGVLNDDFMALMALRAQKMGDIDMSKQVVQPPFKPRTSPSLIFDSPEAAAQFLNSAADLKARGVELLSPVDRLSGMQASETAETTLGLLAPQVNGMLEELSNNGGAVQGLLTRVVAGDIAQMRIPEIEGADGYFGMDSQAALQSFMRVLSHKAVLDLEGQPWEYTPDKGADILEKLRDQDNPPAFLNFIKDETKRAQFDAFIESKVLPEFITALDHLHSRGALAPFALDRGQNADFPRLSQNLVEREAARLSQIADEDQNALKLFDALVKGYSGTHHINDILPADEQREIYIDLEKSMQARLEGFYKGAREAFNKQNPNAGPRDFEAYLLPMLLTMDTLPFGSRAQRNAFTDSIKEALQSANGDASAFAKSAAKAIEKAHSGDVPVIRTWPDPNEVSLHPKLLNPALADEGADFLPPSSLVFEGKALSINDLMQAYENHNTSKSPIGYISRGEEPPAHMAYMAFKDNQGQIYIAGVEKSAMVFTVEKLDMDMLDKYLDPQGYMDAHAGRMSEADIAAQQKIIDTYNSHISAYYESAGHPSEAYAITSYLRGFARKELMENDPAFALVFGNGLSHSIMEFYTDMKAGNEAPSLLAVAAKAEVGAKEVKERTQAAAERRSTPPPSAPVIARKSVAEEFKDRADNRSGSVDIDKAHPQNLESNRIALLAGQARRGPVFLDDNTLEFLSRFDSDTRHGEPLQIGSYPGAEARIKHIHIKDHPPGQPMMLYFDSWHNPDGNGEGWARADGSIRVIPVDPAMLSADTRTDMLRKSHESPIEYYTRMKEDYPVSFEVASSMWRRIYEKEAPPGAGGPLDHKDLEKFDDIVAHMVNGCAKGAKKAGLEAKTGLSRTFHTSEGEKPRAVVEAPQSDPASLRGKFAQGRRAPQEPDLHRPMHPEPGSNPPPENDPPELK